MTASGEMRWGILGPGYIAEQFAADLPSSVTGRLAAVASRDAGRAAEFGARHGAARTYGSYDELLADDDVDAVYIALPNHLHLEWVERCAEAGKHVLCEKPLALTEDQARRAVAAADKGGVVLLEAFMYRMHPQIALLVELLRDRVVGDVRLVECSFGGNMRGGHENYRMQKSAGGGALMDLGCYGVSMSRLIAGVVTGRGAAEPTSVKALGHLGGTSGVDEWGAAVLAFEEDLIATVSCGNQVDLPSVVRIWGSEGDIVVRSPWQPGIGGREPVIEVGRSGVEGRQVRSALADRPLYAIEADAFAGCVATRRVPFPLMDLDDSVVNMRVLDLWRHEIGLVF